MKSRRFSAFLATLGVLAVARPVLAFDPNYIISDADMTDAYAMDRDQIQAFLDAQGALGGMRLEDYEGRMRWAADIIWYAAQNHGINPRMLLVMLQKEQSLVTEDDPTQKQLDWAMGYAVCDSCSMNDPVVQRWQGFGKQVNSAAMQFSDGYLADIEATGVAAGKYGPGVTVTISGTEVTPENAATAALYAYTPHLHGNKNFANIWQNWFGREYPSGTLMQVPGDAGVWLIQNGYRRPITSQTALRSRYNPDLIVQVSQTTLEAFPEGAAISLPNYALLKDEAGNLYLLVDDTLRPIDSMTTFRQIGFSEDELLDITNAERDTYTIGTPITVTTVAPQGQLYQLKTNGAVFYIQDGKRHAIFDRSLLNIRFPGQSMKQVDANDLAQFAEGMPVMLPDGVLVRTPEDPAVYVISDGMRRVITSEQIFNAYGYSWDNILFVPEVVMNLHDIGDPLEAAVADVSE